MKLSYPLILLFFISFFIGNIESQTAGSNNIIQGTVTSKNDKEPMIGVNVSEYDANNRVVSGTITDFNGHFVLKVKSLSNKLVFTYIGYNGEARGIEGSVINVSLAENTRAIKEVVVNAKRINTQSGFTIPTREIATAMQTLDMKEIEGIQVSSVDEALQGRIAGLDIMSNSGDPGSGSSMRIRGTTSINGSSEPLIVVNGIPYEVQIDLNFDFANSNQEQYANMLSINPDDILSIDVLKDAAASAVWGSKGANGVLMITTKKGTKSIPRIDYSYRHTNTLQPIGMRMLSGGEYTMLMKQAYFNPLQNSAASNTPEYNYDKTNPDYENYNNNIDWVKEVTRIGSIDAHYLTISGGGERATYRVSGGFTNTKGTVIGQYLNSISSRASLDYSVSDKLKFTTEFSFSNSDNHMNYENLLGIAYRKMPNVSIYKQDSEGNDTNVFYNIPSTSTLNAAQRNLKNPIALASLAINQLKSVRVVPVFRLQYDLIDLNISKLRYSAYVSFDINNSKSFKFLPNEVSNLAWNDDAGGNISNYGDSEGLTVQTDNNILWEPKFENKDHYFLLYGSIQTSTGNSSGQGITSRYLPSGQAIDASNPALITGLGTSYSSWRSMGVLGRFHYSYKSRYIVSATLRRDGSTKFGNGNKFGNFPGVSLKWILSDEPFMMQTNKWLSMLAFRPGWGISGNQPKQEYLHYSRYGNAGYYMGLAATDPTSLRLNDLKWETTSSLNYGADIGFFEDKYVFDLNLYHKVTKDMLFPNQGLPASSGFSNLSYINGGSMQNDGWEVNFYANKFFQTSDKAFSIDFRFNLSNYVNTILYLNSSILNVYNTDFTYTNGTYITRIQEGNSFGSIYGFKYKGVYQYDQYVEGLSDGVDQSPVSRDENGQVNLGQDGKPLSMYFGYGTSNEYKFRGGDAIYEDVNHDGNIDKLDIQYLGNSNPKLNGGFGPTFRYKNLSCTMFFNFRYGNKIVNAARMYATNMYTDDNQSRSVNWRWRKDGDITDMPRALYGYGYNWLGSDRYIEDGSFLRFKYLTFNYSFPQESLKKYHLNKLNLYLTANNLFVWTKYTGVDPEVGYGSMGVSVDGAKTPRSKDLTLGLLIGL